jgi:competence protein ComFC
VAFLENAGIRRTLLRQGSRLFALFFPSACDLCAGELGEEDAMRLCRGCIDRLAFPAGEARCARCDHPLDEGECPACAVNPLRTTACRCLFSNTGLAKEFLAHYKFQRRRSYAAVIAVRLEKALGEWIRSHDLLVPVPIARSARWERDFCPVTEPVKALSRRIGVPWAPALVKNRPGFVQHLRGRRERKAQNLAPFCVRPEILPPGVKKILLVDDILTTGTTLNLAADLLRSARPDAEVGGMAFGRTVLRAAGDRGPARVARSAAAV